MDGLEVLAKEPHYNTTRDVWILVNLLYNPTQYAADWLCERMIKLLTAVSKRKTNLTHLFEDFSPSPLLE